MAFGHNVLWWPLAAIMRPIRPHIYSQFPFLEKNQLPFWTHGLTSSAKWPPLTPVIHGEIVRTNIGILSYKREIKNKCAA